MDEAAERALIELAKADIGHWETTEPPPEGGRPARVFVLDSVSVHQNQNPKNTGENGGSGSGAEENNETPGDDWGEI